jgi:tetratricopeptide (TPR) repeat protein
VRIPCVVLAGLLVGQFSSAQTVTETKQFRKHLNAAKALLAQAPPNLLLCGDTGWQVEKAREQCKAALVLSPENSDALSTMGSILFRKGMYQSASERDKLFEHSMGCYRRAIEADPKNADAHEGIAQLLQVNLMQRLDKALTKAGMWMGQNRPLGQAAISEDERLGYRTEVEDAARHAQLKLTADPKAVPAMLILADIARVRAYLAGSQEEFAMNMREVDSWFRKIASSAKKPATTRPCDTGGILGGLPPQAPSRPK